MPEPLPERLHTVIEVAAYLGKSVPTVYRLIRSQEIAGQQSRWRMEDLRPGFTRPP